MPAKKSAKVARKAAAKAPANAAKAAKAAKKGVKAAAPKKAGGMMAGRKPRPPVKPGETRLLSGGNPQIAKGDGDAPVQAYIAAMPEWKQRVGRQVDDLISKTIPGVRKAVKWNSPMYGVAGNGYFVSMHCFDKYVKLAFFFGASLRPMPPGESTQKNVRYLDVRETDRFDEAQFVLWVKQASAIPGWDPGGK